MPERLLNYRQSLWRANNLRNYTLALILALICATATAAFAEENDSNLKSNATSNATSNAISGSDAANSALETDSGLVFVNLTEAIEANPIAAGNNSSVSRLVFGGNMSANLVQITPGTEVRMHYHEGVEEAILVLGGQGVLSTGEMNYTVTAGDLVYLPVNMPTAMYVVGEENLELVSLYAPPSDGSRVYV